jgi:hypothetical protein
VEPGPFGDGHVDLVAQFWRMGVELSRRQVRSPHFSMPKCSRSQMCSTMCNKQINRCLAVTVYTSGSVEEAGRLQMLVAQVRRFTQ